MYIKIYFGDATIIIHDEASTPVITKHKIFFREILQPDKKLLRNLQKEFRLDMNENYSFQVEDVSSFFQTFSTAYTLIQAAGGVVQNSNKDILFIHRLGKWDLPKGKIEAGETPTLAAAREITEETGVGKILLTKFICKTYHLYPGLNKTFLKTTHWFHFTSEDDTSLLPQIEENITAVKWIPTKNIKDPVKDTYKNIKDVLSTYFDSP